MPNHRSPISNLQSPIPTYLLLPDAARKYHISEKVLTRLIQDGRIEAAKLPSGELLVADNDMAQAKTREQIIEEKFAHLKGRPITISEASDKYNVPGQTIRGWIARRYITIIDDGYSMTIDEGEMAYCAKVYHERKTSGISVKAPIPLLDENGLPYELKHKKLLEYRQRKREQARKVG